MGKYLFRGLSIHPAEENILPRRGQGCFRRRGRMNFDVSIWCICVILFGSSLGQKAEKQEGLPDDETKPEPPGGDAEPEPLGGDAERKPPGGDTDPEPPDGDAEPEPPGVNLGNYLIF